MPYSNSIYSTDTIPISEVSYYTQHQAHSHISQAPHVIAFSTASPVLHCPMTDHHNHSIDIRDLDARLARVEQLQHQQNPTQPPTTTSETSINTHGDSQRHSRPPLDTSLLPRITKSSTMSTTSTSTTSASATTRLYPETVGLAPGTFSKPRVPKRSRRDTFSSSSSSSAENRGGHQHQQPEFRYYGRHGNQWLFNDFSVTGAVAKGVRRVFGSREGGEKDWFEERKG